jgi:hypothetical protein
VLVEISAREPGCGFRRTIERLTQHVGLMVDHVSAGARSQEVFGVSAPVSVPGPGGDRPNGLFGGLS